MVDNQHWLDRWHEDRIGFHEATVNMHLQTYFPNFGLAAGERVFVPLCGKAHDIAWLAQQGCEVIGVELSQLAVEAFFDENRMDYECRTRAGFTIYRAGNITLMQGDFYDLKAADIKGCRLVYDRAALIAIEAPDRPRYCQHMLKIIPLHCRMLLITLAYDQQQMRGPPFAVADEEVYQFYQDSFAIERVTSSDIIDERPRWRQVGLTELNETVFRLDD